MARKRKSRKRRVCGGKRRTKKVVRHRKKSRKNQVGMGVGAAVEGIYTALRMASNRASRMKPSSAFRHATVHRYGIPRAMRRRMYKNA